MKFGIREILFLVLMGGLLASSYLFVFKPASDKRIQRQAEMEKRKRELSDVKLLTAGIGDVEKKIQELEQAIAIFEGGLPKQKDVDKILKEVWQMAEANSLQTRTIKTLKTQKYAYYSEQPIEMSLAGDYKNGFHAFLKQLESLDRIIRINQMKLDRISSQDGQVQAHLTLSIFFEGGAGTQTASAAN